MVRYCRAYPLPALFGSAEFAAAHGGELGPGEPAVAYVWDDYSVTAEPFAGTPALFAGESSAWRRFCDAELGFTAPTGDPPEQVAS